VGSDELWGGRRAVVVWWVPSVFVGIVSSSPALEEEEASGGRVERGGWSRDRRGAAVKETRCWYRQTAAQGGRSPMVLVWGRVTLRRGQAIALWGRL